MRCAAILVVCLGLAGCVSDDSDVAAYDAASYYDDGGYYHDPYVYGDAIDPGPRGYVSTGYFYGRPWPYYGGYYRYRRDSDRPGRDGHDHDHDRNDGPDRERIRGARSDTPSRGDGEPRVRTRTGFQRPGDRPIARPSPGSTAGHGAPSRR